MGNARPRPPSIRTPRWSKLTPIEEVSPDLWVKRDDLFRYAGVQGSKARTCLYLCHEAKAQGKTGLVTSCSIHSPLSGIVAHVTRKQNLKCRVYVSKHTRTTPELEVATRAGAIVVHSTCTYQNVVDLQAAKWANSFRNYNDWFLLPFGLRCQQTLDLTAQQVRRIPKGVKRIVVPVGSGITLAGVLSGLAHIRSTLPVLGIMVGRDPTKVLQTFAYRERRRCKLVRSKLSYSTRCQNVMMGDIRVDEMYEAKCLPHLEKGDMLWIVSIRHKDCRSVGKGVE